MAEEYDEVADVLGLPAEDEDEAEQEEGQEGEGWASGSGTDAEPPPSGAEQEDAGQESSGESGDVETGEEGSDTGKPPDEEPVEAKSDDQIATLMTKLEALEKSNSGLYAELRSERDRRKEADARRDALMAEVQKRADAEDAAKKEAGLPDKDEDPVGYMEARERQLFESVEQRLERMEQSRQQEQKQEVFQQAVATVNADEERFRQERGDYDDALNFARQERARLLRATHPDQTDDWVSQQISNGDRMFALQSLQQGISPAQRAYDYAVRLGYKAGQTGESGNGGQAAPAAAPAPAPAGQGKPAEKPRQTSLSAAAGRSGGRGRKITMEEAVELPDLEFDAIFQDPVKSRELSDQGYTWA